MAVEQNIIGQVTYGLTKPNIQKCQIQIKDLIASKSFTVYGYDVQELYNRFVFMLTELEKSNGEVRIIHYKKRDKDEKKDNVRTP